MVDRRYAGRRSDGVELVETFSTENFKLKQQETGVVYCSSVIDVIAGYNADEKPYSRYTYTETNEKDEQAGEPTSEDYENALSELGVDINDEA